MSCEFWVMGLSCELWVGGAWWLVESVCSLYEVPRDERGEIGPFPVLIQPIVSSYSPL